MGNEIKPQTLTRIPTKCHIDKGPCSGNGCYEVFEIPGEVHVVGPLIYAFKKLGSPDRSYCRRFKMKRGFTDQNE